MKIHTCVQKKRLIHITIMMSVCIVGVCALFFFVGSEQAYSQKEEELSPNNPAGLLDEMDALIASIQERKNVTRDEIKREQLFSITQMTQSDEIMLTGVAWNEERPLAFINGQVVEKNGKVGTMKVIEITPESVTVVDKDGKEKVVNLYANSIADEKKEK